jgi:hypothetical protein
MPSSSGTVQRAELDVSSYNLQASKFAQSVVQLDQARNAFTLESELAVIWPPVVSWRCDMVAYTAYSTVLPALHTPLSRRSRAGAVAKPLLSESVEVNSWEFTMLPLNTGEFGYNKLLRTSCALRRKVMQGGRGG